MPETKAMFLLDSFSSIQLTTIASAYFIAALVKGVTGLGFSSTCLPISPCWKQK